MKPHHNASKTSSEPYDTHTRQSLLSGVGTPPSKMIIVPKGKKLGEEKDPAGGEPIL
jgi:hypothetical protein